MKKPVKKLVPERKYIGRLRYQSNISRLIDDLTKLKEEGYEQLYGETAIRYHLETDAEYNKRLEEYNNRASKSVDKESSALKRKATLKEKRRQQYEKLKQEFGPEPTP